MTMGAFSTFSLIKQKEDSIASIDNNTLQLSQTIQEILRVSMLKNRREDISSSIKNIVGNEGIQSVVIINHKGIIKFSSRQQDVNLSISRSDSLCTSCHCKSGAKSNYNLKDFDRFRIDEDKKIIFSSLPIYNAPECYNGVCHETAGQTALTQINNLKAPSKVSGSKVFSVHDSTEKILGFIEMEVSINEIISKLEETRNKLIVFTILFALIASLITYFSIRYLIGRPVRSLVEGTKRVAEGNFKDEIPPGKAELGLLSESFNKMQKQLVLTQSQLIESEKLASIGKLADEVANEIKNPLTGILIFTESLLSEIQVRTKVDNGDLAFCVKDLELIRQQALKIRESIRNILSLSKRKLPVLSKTDLNKILSKSISVVEKFSNFRNIKIINTAQKSLPEIQADSGLLEQVLLNLLLLSSDSMPSGGIINILTAVLNNFLRITFSFTGIGSRPEIFGNLKDPRLSGDPADSTKEGISIAVCRNIIRMHKGKLDINSEGIAIVVTIELPVNA